MALFKVKPIVCDYEAYEVGTSGSICICNIRTNAELIADILNADQFEDEACSYLNYPKAKFKFKRSHGKWKDVQDIGLVFECSKCKVYANNNYDFCPNCGADMREVKADAILFNEPTHEGYAERCNHTQNEGSYDE